MKKALIISSVVLAFILLLAAVLFYRQLSQIKRTELPQTDEELGISDEPVIYEPTPTPSAAVTAAAPTEPAITPVSTPTPTIPDEEHSPEQNPGSRDNDIKNILLFGVDKRQSDDASRSDTIIVVSIDKKNSRIKLTSLMRDMYVTIPGRGANRINAAYAYGGPVLAIKTVNTNFSLNVRDYVTIDFMGFEKIVDAIGGIEIDVKKNESPYCYVESPGMQTLNGRQALAYARMRHTGRSDYERTERQRGVISEIYKKIKSRGALALPSTVTKLLPYVETSLSNEEILKLAVEAAGFDTDSMSQFRLPVDGYYKSQSISGKSVLVPNLEENKKKLHEFIYLSE